MYALLYKIVRIFKRSFFIVKNIKTKLFFFIAVLSFAVSCSNQTTRPELSTESTSKVYGYKTVYYGNKTFTDNIIQEKIESLWKDMIKDKTVYANSSYSSVTGNFKSDANYYETKWNSGNTARTEFRKCTLIEYNNKEYIAGIYWDNQTGIGMQERYRLIVIDENGTEHAWYGGGGNADMLPDDNTKWVKYNFIFGYIKLD